MATISSSIIKYYWMDRDNVWAPHRIYMRFKLYAGSKVTIEPWKDQRMKNHNDLIAFLF